MHRCGSLALLASLLPTAGCGAEPEEFVAPLPIQGAAIDGSDDLPAQLAEPRVNAIEQTIATDLAAGEESGAESAAVEEVSADVPVVEEVSGEESGDPSETPDVAGDAEVAGEAKPLDAEATEQEAIDAALAAKLAAIPEPGEDGVYPLAFTHLSLEGEDIDNIIDFLLFPDEFEEGEGFEFPAQITALDGKEITISGYMIPGRIRKNMVRDFMLVRDLAGCCFGGAPNPDEWIDVVMAEGTEAEYLRYLPITVRGKLELIGGQDQEGYAVGVYRLKATWAGEAD